MIQIYLHDFLPFSPPKALLPATFLQLCREMEMLIDPRLRSVDLDEIDESPQAVDASSEPPESPDFKVPFERSPLTGLNDWCQENDEPWLARACGFLIRHKGICVERKMSYSTWYFSFIGTTLPERWQYTFSAQKTFAELLCQLASEIKSRVEQIEG